MNEPAVQPLEPQQCFPDPPALDGLLDEAALDAALAGTTDPVPVLREALRAGDAALRRHFEAGASAVELVYGRCWLADQLIRRAWGRHFGDATDIALIAVGGYGRGELLPASDIDLLLLLEEGAEARHAAAIETLLMQLWDMKLEVGHSVRTVAECIEQARADITVATNLFEARPLAGPQSLFDTLQAAIGPDRLWSGPEFFAAKLEEQEARHRRFGDTAYNLEPNIKENPGGLRDIQMIGWVAKRHYGCTTLADLVRHGFLTADEYRTLAEGQAFLWRIRFALHVTARRREDRLLFDHQRTLAGLLGYPEDPERPTAAVEAFMKAYYRTVTQLNRLNETLLQLFREDILEADEADTPVPINRRFQTRRGYLEVTAPDIFSRYPFALLELFLILAQRPEIKGVRAATIRLVRAHRHLIDDDFRRDLRARSLFLELIRQPVGVTHQLRRMNRYGILAAYLPAFGQIVGQMQYDLFHAYTVDEHTLFVVRNIRRLTVPEFSHELPFCSRLMQEEIPKPELLVLAGLFHDIGKGRGGDHSELGAADAERFCRDHGLGDYDTELVAWLVRSHLLMSTTAQRRDISDPAVIHEFARQVGSRVRLNYLYLLTVSDIRGTNPELWNAWKDTLLRELYDATAKALRRGLENPQDEQELIEAHRRRAAERLRERGISADDLHRLWASLGDEYFLRHNPREIAWQTRKRLEAGDRETLVALRPDLRGGTAIFIATPARPRLFEVTTAVLEQLGLDIVDARIFTSEDGRALDTYLVLDEQGQPIEDRERRRIIRKRLEQALAPERLQPPPVTRRAPHRFRHFDIPVEVDFRPDPSGERTLVELIAADRPGLLSIVGRVFTEQGVEIHNARIATFGSRAEDAFYVTDAEGQPITDPERQRALRAALVAALEGED